MSVLSASGLLSPAQAEAYKAALLELLGSQSPPQVLQETPSALREALRRFPPVHLDTAEAPGKWSARFVLAHLADSELMAAFRIRMVLTHERPPLVPLDQDLWAQRLYYEKIDAQDALERFAVLRRANLSLWAAASPAALARVGIHGERGEESLDLMRRLYAGHDLAHLHQLARIRILVTGQ